MVVSLHLPCLSLTLWVNRIKMAKILLIEDDLPLVRMYQIVLRKAGFEVVNALDGEEGLQKLKTEKPELVLLDLVMPKVDGFAVLKEVQNDSNYAKIPILCLSVLHQIEDMERAKSLGAVDFLVKTEVTPEEMINRVKKHLKSS